MSVVYTEGLGVFASESSRWRNEGKWTLVQILSTTFVSSSKLLRTTEKKQRATPWTFVWISNTVKSTAVKVATAITIMTETGAIPRPVAERNPQRTRLRPTKEQSALTSHSYQSNLTGHRPSVVTHRFCRRHLSSLLGKVRRSVLDQVLPRAPLHPSPSKRIPSPPSLTLKTKASTRPELVRTSRR